MPRNPYPDMTKVIGKRQVCTDANTDYPVDAPAGASWVVVYFISDGALVEGRVAIGESATDIASITDDSEDTNWHPPMPIDYALNPRIAKTDGAYASVDTHVHVSSPTAGAVCKLSFFYE